MVFHESLIGIEFTVYTYRVAIWKNVSVNVTVFHFLLSVTYFMTSRGMRKNTLITFSWDCYLPLLFFLASSTKQNPLLENMWYCYISKYPTSSLVCLFRQTISRYEVGNRKYSSFKKKRKVRKREPWLTSAALLPITNKYSWKTTCFSHISARPYGLLQDYDWCKICGNDSACRQDMWLHLIYVILWRPDYPCTWRFSY